MKHGLPILHTSYIFSNPSIVRSRLPLPVRTFSLSSYLEVPFAPSVFRINETCRSDLASFNYRGAPLGPDVFQTTQECRSDLLYPKPVFKFTFGLRPFFNLREAYLTIDSRTPSIHGNSSTRQARWPTSTSLRLSLLENPPFGPQPDRLFVMHCLTTRHTRAVLTPTTRPWWDFSLAAFLRFETAWMQRSSSLRCR